MRYPCCHCRGFGCAAEEFFFEFGLFVARYEVVATIALFGYLNRWNDTMATDLEAHPAKVAGRTLGETGWEAGKHGAA